MKVIRRYVLFSYLSPFFKGLAALMLIMAVTHFFDFLHVFLSNKPPFSIVTVYYLNRIPEWFVLILPVATLLAILFSLGSLNRHHELTAIKSSGLKLHYVFIPIILFSLGISVLSFFMQETFVPKSTAKAESLFLQIRDRKPKNINTERKNFKHMGEGRRLYSIERFKDEKADGFTIIEFFPDSFRERRQIYAKKASYTGDNEWALRDGTIRVFNVQGELLSYTEFKNLLLYLRETPDTFAKPERDPEQMDFLSLLAYVGKLRRGGFITRGEEVILHNKISFPFSNTIILILGIPLALWSGTRNRTTGFFISIFIAFIYWGAISVGKALGTRGVLHPALGAWSANLIFLGLSLLMLKFSRIT